MAKKYLMDTSAVIKYLSHTISNEAVDFIDKAIDKKALFHL